MVELNGKFYLAPPKDGSRRDIDIPSWLFDLLQQLKAHARRCRCPRRDDDISACGASGAFLFLGAEGGHARRSNYSARIFRPACDGVYPAQKRRRGYQTEPWRVHCRREPWPGIPVPAAGMHRAKAEQRADCSWRRSHPALPRMACVTGTRPRCGATASPRVLRRERLGHGPSGDIADHYTHIDDEMISDLLTRQTHRWEASVAARARIDESRGMKPRSAVPALDSWLAAFR
jgi:hypothetical protein